MPTLDPVRDTAEVAKPIKRIIAWRCATCNTRVVAGELPDRLICPTCQVPVTWKAVLRRTK